ncbi:MAG: bifunctional diaminohydroxyphosphoribosylaminopyrimidine deaminase/5-amino-6-(5-phosphoribosylamino)uracil reductase RibD [Yoonia sp.]|nr:bifunctional diaminohydroxyphosphoribosylaminopyrimidine deaminase/5-amino-6-(5-phosphoribosylamino)uracil reductase RibD [Yoonia sp.]
MQNQKKTDTRFMALALMLGRRGMGRVWPNPAVGCVLVRNGAILGRGRTADGGRPHAEVVALAQTGDARGATAYVTLEPCAHTGQTGPCAQALIDAGVTRVVVATTDPDPRVSGQGIAMLRGAGVQVDVGICAAKADADHAGFFSRITQKRPFLTLKIASTLDGRIATATGESQWITGPDARRAVHMMRARHDAVMVGGGTVRADDPTLTVRGLGVSRQPVRVIVSNAPLVAPNLQASVANSPVWQCHGPDVAIPDWVTSIACPASDGTINLVAAMAALAEHGITRVFCEGGGALAASLLSAGLVDDLVVFHAGCVIGHDGIPSLAGLGVQALADAPRFELADVRAVGPDIMHRWTRA